MATDLTGSTGSEVGEENERNQREEEEEDEEEDKGPAPHLLLQLALGKELAKSNRLLTFLLFALSDFLAFVAIYIPYTYLPPLALAHNILPGDAAFLVSLLGLPALSPAFGLVTAFRGVAALLGPPSAGMLVDRFDNHGLALYLTGGLLLSSTLIEIFASLANFLHERRNGYTQLE